MTSRATEELLDLLHGMTATELMAEIRAFRNGERLGPQKWDREGNELPRDVLSLPPALIAQAIKFLKDNGVDRAVKVGDPTDLLADELDDFENSNVSPFRLNGST